MKYAIYYLAYCKICTCAEKMLKYAVYISNIPMQTAYNPKPIYDNAEPDVISQNVTCLSAAVDLI
jgi:hypothetical protein